MPDTSTLRLPPDLTDQARHSDLFRDLDDATVAPLLPCLTRHSLPIGDHLFDQGEVGDSLYILLYGRLGVRLMLADGAVQELDELTPGTTVGEMALLTGQPRAATVYALVDSQLARLDRADFKQLAQERPSELRCFAEGILPRLRRPRHTARCTYTSAARRKRRWSGCPLCTSCDTPWHAEMSARRFRSTGAHAPPYAILLWGVFHGHAERRLSSPAGPAEAHQTYVARPLEDTAACLVRHRSFGGARPVLTTL